MSDDFHCQKCGSPCEECDGTGFNFIGMREVDCECVGILDVCTDISCLQREMAAERRGRASKKASIIAMLNSFIARGIETDRDRTVVSTIRAVRDYIERDEDEVLADE